MSKLKVAVLVVEMVVDENIEGGGPRCRCDG